MGYEHAVRTSLAPHYTVWAPAENGTTSTHMLARMSQWLEEQQPSIVHINCGLHDLRFNPGETNRQVPLDIFENNLHQLFQLLRSANPGARLIWATITPVMDEWHQGSRPSRRHNADVIEYNATALAVAVAHELEINDLYAHVMQKGPNSMLDRDGVHYTEHGYAMLAAKVIESVRRNRACHVNSN